MSFWAASLKRRVRRRISFTL